MLLSRTLLRERWEATLEQRYMRYTLIKMNVNVTVLAERIGALRDRYVKECMSMETPNPHLRSYLFTVRVWQEEIGTDQVELRGKVQLVTNGDVRYFRGWPALAPLLLTMLSELDSNPEPNH
jgi:hypothetical protein